MEISMRYEESHGRKPVSVEEENCGWDISSLRGGRVARYIPGKGEGRTIVADLQDRHAKEILVANAGTSDITWPERRRKPGLSQSAPATSNARGQPSRSRSRR